jgi:hypothetical protein
MRLVLFLITHIDEVASRSLMDLDPFAEISVARVCIEDRGPD